MNGIINVYKECGYTSHDVVAKLRGILKQKKIGHTGTLDPEAEGVLPVCLGKATKLCDLLAGHDKVYEAVMLLGQSTDTQDTTGTVLESAPVTASEEEVREAVLSFEGPYEQIPPMYSALKVNGQKLCDLARAGKEVERKARPVEIYEIQIEEIHLPRVRMTVSCSKGTYIRTIIHDLGEALGAGGVLTSIERTSSSGYDISQSHTLDEIQTLVDSGKSVEDIMLSIDSAFEEYEKIVLNQKHTRLYKNGVRLRDEQVGVSPDKSLYRVYGFDNEFLGLGCFKNGEFCGRKNFY